MVNLRYPQKHHGFLAGDILPLIIAGWWYTYPSEKCDFVSWGYYYCLEQYEPCSKPPTSIWYIHIIKATIAILLYSYLDTMLLYPDYMFHWKTYLPKVDPSPVTEGQLKAGIQPTQEFRPAVTRRWVAIPWWSPISWGMRWITKKWYLQAYIWGIRCINMVIWLYKVIYIYIYSIIFTLFT